MKRKLTKQQRLNIANAKIGIKHTKAHNKKISDTCKLHKINVTHGKSTYQHYCEQCGKKISWKALLCGSCASKKRCENPKNHGSFIDGRTLQTHYCIDCKVAPISLGSWRKGQRCLKCSGIHNMKTMMQKGCKHYKEFLMKSNWEIDYAKWLDKQKMKWEYENKTFDLGNTTYTPDFYLPESDTYIEIKGWFREDAKQKMLKFHKIFPQIKLYIISDFLSVKIRNKSMFPFKNVLSISSLKKED